MAILVLSFVTYKLIFFVAFLVFLWYRHKFSYWSCKGVKGPKPAFPFGNIQDVITRKIQFFQPYCDSYIKYKNLPYVGMYSFHRPVLCIRDPDIAKLILIKDFDHFQSHGIFSGGVGDPLAGHLFNIHGSAWKNLRVKMSPTFTSGKLRSMYPLVENIANEALDYADRVFSNGESMNFSDFYEKYSMEIIGSVGFGVECNGFKDPKSEFHIRGQEYFEPKSLYWDEQIVKLNNFLYGTNIDITKKCHCQNWTKLKWDHTGSTSFQIKKNHKNRFTQSKVLRTLKRTLAFVAPDIFKSLKLKRISPRIVNFFYSLVAETVAYREKHSYKRNDFLQTLIELKNGTVIDEEGETKHIHGFPFSMRDVAANTMLYMFAGYETSATTGQFAAYELARNRHIQERVREEVQRVLAKYGGECPYEAQQEMVYLNMVLDETMRKYPPLRALFRRCNKEYKLPNSDLVIDRNTLIFIPIHAIQMDPEIFPEPENFDPERFSPENKAKRHPCHWMPFGEGPRKCLGLRQGYIQSKMALVKLLQKYELVLDARTPVPMRIKASSLPCAADGGVWLKLRKLRDSFTDV